MGLSGFIIWVIWTMLLIATIVFARRDIIEGSTIFSFFLGVATTLFIVYFIKVEKRKKN